MTEKNQSVFEKLNSINVNGKTEKKLSLTYLSWSFAWGEVKKIYPEASYLVYESVNPQGYTTNYFTDGSTAWVKTGVTINGLEHVEQLPVMDNRNNSIPLKTLTSKDVNKAIQRSITKAIARHGLGLYIYAGEDLPEIEQNSERNDNVQKSKMSVKNQATIQGYVNSDKANNRNWVNHALSKLKFESIDSLDDEQATKLINTLRLYKEKFEEKQSESKQVDISDL